MNTDEPTVEVYELDLDNGTKTLRFEVVGDDRQVYVTIEDHRRDESGVVRTSPRTANLPGVYAVDLMNKVVGSVVR